jgi:hypothetical protein
MTDKCQSCSECIKVASRVIDQSEDHEELKKDFHEHKKMIWGEMNKRLSTNLFKWMSSFLIAFCIGCGGLQMAMLTQIAGLKTDIAVLMILIEKTGNSSSVLLKEKNSGE